MKNRLVRVRELLQRELGALLARDHGFPSVLVTVNDVDITPDLKHAYFYIGVIGPEQEAQHVVDVLNRRHGEWQTRVSRRVILKNTPQFHFRLDHSVERGVRVTGIMETIDRQLAESAAREAASGRDPGDVFPSGGGTGIDDDDEPETDGDGGDDDDEEQDVDAEAGEPDDREEPARAPRRKRPRRSPRDFTAHDNDD